MMLKCVSCRLLQYKEITPCILHIRSLALEEVITGNLGWGLKTKLAKSPNLLFFLLPQSDPVNSLSRSGSAAYVADVTSIKTHWIVKAESARSCFDACMQLTN